MTLSHYTVRRMVRDHVGGANAIPGRILADAIGANPHSSAVRDLVHDLRMRGEVILANSRGYYAPRDNEEVRAALEVFNHRIAKIAQARDALALSAL